MDTANNNDNKNDGDEMIVVTGYKRSGTSLMMALVEKLGRVELQYCPHFEAALRAYHGGKNDFYYEDAKLTAKKIQPGSRTVWFDGAVKMFSHVVTHNVKHVPPHLENNVKVIWMYRDPSKIERSIRRYKKPNTVYAGPGGVSSSTLEDEMAIISKLDELHQEAIRELPHVLTVNFDDLLANPVAVAKQLSEFLGRPFEMKMVDEYLELVNKDKAALASSPETNKKNVQPSAASPMTVTDDIMDEEFNGMAAVAVPC